MKKLALSVLIAAVLIHGLRAFVSHSNLAHELNARRTAIVATAAE